MKPPQCNDVTPIPRETPQRNSVQHSVGDNSSTPPSLCCTEKSPEWINYCRCTCPPPHWGYLPYPSYQHASCLMTAGDYLCQRKICRFKTPGPPPRSITESLCTRATLPVHHTCTRGASHYTAGPRRSKMPTHLC